MSYRRMMYIAVLFILLVTTGCSLFRFVDNSSPDDIQKFETSKDDLWNQKKALEQEKAAHLKQLADQQAQIVLMHRGMSDQQTKIAQANRQITEANKIIEDLTIQIKLLEDEKERTVKTAEPVQPEKETPTKTIRGPKKELRKKPAAAQRRHRKPRASRSRSLRATGISLRPVGWRSGSSRWATG